MEMDFVLKTEKADKTVQRVGAQGASLYRERRESKESEDLWRRPPIQLGILVLYL